MKSFLLAGVAAATIGCAAFFTSPVSAAPVAPGSVEQPASGVAQTQMRRERRMMRRNMRRSRMMNRRGMSRRSMMNNSASPANAGNARNPNAPVMQQNQGQTAGGARR